MMPGQIYRYDKAHDPIQRHPHRARHVRHHQQLPSHERLVEHHQALKMIKSPIFIIEKRRVWGLAEENTYNENEFKKTTLRL